MNDIVLHCMANIYIYSTNQKSVPLWLLSCIYMNRSPLFSPALLLSKTEVRMLKLYYTNKTSIVHHIYIIYIPFTFAFRDGGCRRIAVPVPFPLINEPIVYLLQL